MCKMRPFDQGLLPSLSPSPPLSQKTPELFIGEKYMCMYNAFHVLERSLLLLKKMPSAMQKKNNLLIAFLICGETGPL